MSNVTSIRKDQASISSAAAKSVGDGMPFRLYLLEKMPLIRAADDPAALFAEIPHGQTRVLVPIQSAWAHAHMNQLADDHSGGDPDAFIIKAEFKDHVEYLRAKAPEFAVTRPVAKRYAWDVDEGVLWIDLALPDGRSVRVSADGWTVDQPLHPLFVRTPTQLPLPVPEQSDDGAAAFRRCLPPGLTVENTKLLIGAVLGCMVPRDFASSFAYPVVVLVGDAGAGKSTLARLIKRLTDPEVTPLAAKPRNIDDLFIDGQGCHLVNYDNIDFIRHGLSDAFCQLVTGSAITKRKLYTDGDRLIVRAHNPVLLNGINVDIPKSDLLDRCLHIHLSRIDQFDPQAADRSEAELPLVMGYLCDILARALRNYATTDVPNAPRLSLLAKLCAAAEPFGCDTPFVELLRRSQHEALLASRDNDLVIAALFELTKRQPAWTGTYKQLLTTLANHADDATTRSPEWPASPHKLSRHIKEHSRLLAAQGLTVTNGRKTEAGRIVHLARASESVVDDSIPF